MASIDREEQLRKLYEERNRIDALKPIEFAMQKQETIRYCLNEERKRKFIEETEKAINELTKDSTNITSNTLAKTYAEKTKLYGKERD